MPSIGRRTGPWAVLASTALLPPLLFALPGPASAASPSPGPAQLPLTTPAAPVPSRYTVTDLGTLGSGDASVANAINNAGTVVGNFNPTSVTTHGFRWSAGTMTDLGVEAPGSSSFANAVNDAGQVAGTAERSQGGYGYPVRWSATGVLQDLGGPITNRLGVGNGIDPGGRVAGGQRPADSEGSPLGILYDRAGQPTELGDVGAATGINARGQVVGSSPAYIWKDGTLTGLAGFPSTGSGPEANAINVKGTVAGATGLASGALVAVLWPGSPAAPIDLGTVDGFMYSEATAINAAGQVVGTADPNCLSCQNTTARAWIWRPGDGITDLNNLLPGGSGWTLYRANGLNDRGQIVGLGLHDGHLRGYLLTPAFSATVNFQPAGAAVPTGYTADSGAVYGPRAGGRAYGWNIDNSTNTRDRNASDSPDQRYDTLIHLQRPGSATRWEIAVPNGRYTVHLVGGDPGYTDSTYRVSVEGTIVLDGSPTLAQPWLEGTAQVDVTDGRLSVTNAAGSSNDKLNYLDIISS
jgi:probable HAF family extracellular repeat protein